MYQNIGEHWNKTFCLLFQRFAGENVQDGEAYIALLERTLAYEDRNRYQQHRRQILSPVSLALLIPVSTIPAANLPPVSTMSRRWQIATGINDTGGKFATGVKDTAANISANLQKDSKRP
jgi:hypothetical protein